MYIYRQQVPPPYTMEFFKEFLLDLLGDATNRNLDIVKAHQNASQGL